MKATKSSIIEKAPLPAVIKHLLDLSGSTAAVEIHHSAGGQTIAGGKYSLAKHKITLYWDGIEEQCRLLYGSLKPFDQHLAAVFAHELGHAEDSELNTLADQLDQTNDPLQRKRIALRIETNAWNYAIRLLQERDSEFLQFLMYISLEPYHDGDAA
ncbi:hypothetical protein [Domibacillus iocasae]|uniref:hypothetical protein n=1 Tax=Domibacillus iocasae TaxID=1714016 RepID=UPI0009F275DE|nr:hypothetical protein [Domibacillus iocasae]